MIKVLNTLVYALFYYLLCVFIAASFYPSSMHGWLKVIAVLFFILTCGIDPLNKIEDED